MFNTKKTEVILVIFLIIFISGFFLIQNPNFITKIFLIDTRATTQGLSLSLTITGCSEEEINSTITGQANFTDLCNIDTIQRIEGLDSELSVKIRVYTNATLPTGFVAAPATLVRTPLKYINITVNDTLTGTAIIYFNLSQSTLGLIEPEDIRLYRYGTSWVELDTYVIDGTSDPAEFNATTTQFSNFLIGEKEPTAPSTITPSGATGEMSHGGKTVEKEEPELLPKKPLLPVTPKVVKEEEKISEVKINILLATLLVFIVFLAITFFYWNKITKELHLEKKINRFKKQLPFNLAKVKFHFIILIFLIAGLIYLTGTVIPTGYTILPPKTEINLLNSSIFIIILGVIGLFCYKKFKK